MSLSDDSDSSEDEPSQHEASHMNQKQIKKRKEKPVFTGIEEWNRSIYDKLDTDQNMACIKV